MRNLLIFLLSLAFSVNAAAIAATCGDLDTQVAMDQCAMAQFQQLDKEMSKAYTEYRSRLDGHKKRQIKEVQFAWEKFRDLACRFESSGVEGGSAHPFIFRSCLAEKTRVRLRNIILLASCEEGDLSCPAWK